LPDGVVIHGGAGDGDTLMIFGTKHDDVEDLGSGRVQVGDITYEYSGIDSLEIIAENGNGSVNKNHGKGQAKKSEAADGREASTAAEPQVGNPGKKDDAKGK